MLLAVAMHAVRGLATSLPCTRQGRSAWGCCSSVAASPSDCSPSRRAPSGADRQDVLFSGQTAIPEVVAETSAATIVVLFLAKGVAYAICLGVGFRGGPVFPAIFLGIAMAMLAVVWLDVSPTLAVAVGRRGGDGGCDQAGVLRAAVLAAARR